MVLKIYNTLTRSIEEFKPIDPQEASLYTCGPTVYNYPHIGNYRAYIFGDILKRVLLYNGYAVKHIMNLTDVDDKTIRDSIKAGKSLEDFTEFYSEEFFKDLDALNIIKADVYPKATEHIQEMIGIIENLLEKEIAYKGEDGSIYFNISKDTEYGKLSHLDLEKLKEGGSNRIIKDEYEKENAQDFALWKAYDEADGNVSWDAPFGKGRPGWHIECSAMSMKYLGETLDIHTGGIDLIFPHHENEIAQSESASGKPFVKYWMHNEWLLVDGKKMAKSAGNFYTLRDIIEKGYSPLAFRYLTLQSSYRTPLNFTWESLDASKIALKKMSDMYLGFGDGNGKVSAQYEKEFHESINDDLGIPKALGIVWKMLGDETVSNEDKKMTLLKFDTILGLGIDKTVVEIIPENVMILAKERESARASKDWSKSDEIRKQIEELGYTVRDGENGQVIEKR